MKRTLTHYLLKYYYPELLHNVLQEDGETGLRSLLNMPDDNGATPVTFCLKLGKLKIVREVVERYSDVRFDILVGGYHSLNLALLEKDLKLAFFILEKITTERKPLPGPDENGNLTLHLLFECFDEDPTKARQIASRLLLMG